MIKEEKRLQRKAKLARIARCSATVAVVALPVLAPAMANDEMITAIDTEFGKLLSTAAKIAAATAVVGIGIVVAQYGPLIGINLTRKIAGAATK